MYIVYVYVMYNVYIIYVIVWKIYYEKTKRIFKICLINVFSFASETVGTDIQTFLYVSFLAYFIINIYMYIVQLKAVMFQC